jgi:hypothetical protein
MRRALKLARLRPRTCGKFKGFWRLTPPQSGTREPVLFMQTHRPAISWFETARCASSP